MTMDAASVVQVAEAVEYELDGLRATPSHPYSRIERGEKILVAESGLQRNCDAKIYGLLIPL